MDGYSRETLRMIEENNDTVIELGIGNKGSSFLSRDGRLFTSTNGGDYSRLGSCIGRNTHLKTLYVELRNIRLSIADSGFFDSIKQNSSIREFKLSGYGNTDRNPVGEVGCALLKAFQNNSHLTTLRIWSCDLGNVDDRVVINTTLSSCTNLKRIYLTSNDITDEQLLPMVEAIRGNGSLQELYLWTNRIGNAGCDALATLLQDPSCNLVILDIHHNRIWNEGAIAIANSLANDDKLKKLDLRGNQIGNEGAIAIANSLASNIKLKKLDLRGNRIDDSPKIVEDAFSRVLCNSSSINATYSSNHTLSKFAVGHETRLQGEMMGIELVILLDLNRGINKKYVAIKKILQHHPNIDVDQLFEWGSGDDRNLMALPYVVAWFDRAGEAVEHDEESVVSDDSSDSDHSSSSSEEEANYNYQVEERKLTAIYEFTLAMPILFIPDDKKRKRNDW